MTATYDCIATVAVTSATLNVTFSSIPQTFTDLVAVINGGASAGTFAWINTGANISGSGLFSDTILYASTTAAVSQRRSGQDESVYTPPGENEVDNSLNWNAVINFMNYSNTTTFKSIITRSGRAGSSTTIGALLRRDTSAINTIQFDLASTNTWNVGTTFSLYGIKAE